jgi:hypothetical protein
LILELGNGEPTVVILDEYQYLHGDPNENVDSALAAVWESHVNRRPKGRPFVLVLCGSIVRVMARLDAQDNPLHGRLAWKGHLDPFDYFDAAAMAHFRTLVTVRWHTEFTEVHRVTSLQSMSVAR